MRAARPGSPRLFPPGSCALRTRATLAPGRPGQGMKSPAVGASEPARTQFGSGPGRPLGSGDVSTRSRQDLPSGNGGPKSQPRRPGSSGAGWMSRFAGSTDPAVRPCLPHSAHQASQAVAAEHPRCAGGGERTRHEPVVELHGRSSFFAANVWRLRMSRPGRAYRRPRSALCSAEPGLRHIRTRPQGQGPTAR